MALDTWIGAGDVWPERPANSLDGSVDTFAAAETQPGGPGTTLPCRDDLLRELKERTKAVVEPISGGNPGSSAGGRRAWRCSRVWYSIAASERRLFHDL